METQATLIRETASASELAARAISSVVNGEVDPITAHINISRMEKAIAIYKDNVDVRDITLRELSKYGKKQTFGDCVLEECESGVKYDYSMCGDSKLADMYATLEALKADNQRTGNDVEAHTVIWGCRPRYWRGDVPAGSEQQNSNQDNFQKTIGIMAELINVSLCVSDIPRDKIFVAENGKKYISICVSELREADQYENTHCVFMRQSKEERERKDKRVYVGRGKSVVFRPAEPTPDQVADLPVAENVDDLPF